MIVDSKRDLDGVLISEKSDLLRTLISKWDNGIKKIPFSDMMRLNIFTTASKLRIGNFILYTNLPFDKSYLIDIKDSKKDAQGRWTDKETSAKRIITELKKLENDLKIITTERKLHSLISNHLKQTFHSVSSEVSIGDLKTTKIDIEVGQKIGIELKMAKSLDRSSELQRTIGQVTYEYIKKYPGSCLLVVVGGPAVSRTSRVVKELSTAVKKQKSNFYYLETK